MLIAIVPPMRASTPKMMKKLPPIFVANAGTAGG